MANKKDIQGDERLENVETALSKTELWIEEHQKQKAWSEKTLKEALWKAGFRTVSFYGDYTLTAPKENSQRWHIAAVRTEE